MVYVVQFADGQTAQINAGNDLQAMKFAVKKYPDRRVIAVKKAGLLEMGYRRPPRGVGR
jgi:hypothetical protein